MDERVGSDPRGWRKSHNPDRRSPTPVKESPEKRKPQRAPQNIIPTESTRDTTLTLLCCRKRAKLIAKEEMPRPLSSLHLGRTDLVRRGRMERKKVNGRGTKPFFPLRPPAWRGLTGGSHLTQFKFRDLKQCWT